MCFVWTGVLWVYYRLDEFFLAIQIRICKIRYAKQLNRIRSKNPGDKIRVLFIVSEIAKWKEQWLYKAMEKSGVFEPIVGLSAWNQQREHLCSNDELLRIHSRAEKFFDALGDRHVRTVRIVNGKRVFCDIAEFEPDVVYYTEPWSPCRGQDPFVVSKCALTFYSPYFVPNYGRLELDCHLRLHRMLFGYFCLNALWKKAFEDSLVNSSYCAKFIPAGHPALDFFTQAEPRPSIKNYIIYAPHYSITHPSRVNQFYSTFTWNRNEILAYAKCHSEFNWVFKPHPLLRKILTKTGYMSKEEVEGYYAEWAKIGLVCEDGDYQELFLESRVMITDCGSFLSEYGATGKPIIHLISPTNKCVPIWLTKQAYDTYYQVHDSKEMYSVFKMILEEGLDPRKEERLKAVRDAGFSAGCASDNIIRYLREILRR